MRSLRREIYRRQITGGSQELQFLHPADPVAVLRSSWDVELFRRQTSGFLFRGRHFDTEVEGRIDDQAKKNHVQLIEFLWTRPRQYFWQDFAASVFLERAFYCIWYGYAARTPRNLDANRHRLLQIAEDLGNLADDGSLGFRRHQVRALALVSHDCYFRAGNFPHPSLPLIIERHRTDAEVRAFAILMTTASQAIFGGPLYGTVAILANVLFDRTDLTDSRIRQMSRRPSRH
jgi:hypothetical protein